jgi:hypothetical protein
LSKIEFEVKIDFSNEEILLRNSDQMIRGYQNIMEYIQKSSNLDSKISEKQKSEIIAYKSLLDYKLKPLLVF